VKKSNLRGDIETALAGGVPERVPFSFYDVLYPAGLDPRPLQARGMAVSARRRRSGEMTPSILDMQILCYA
jgi:hypothetical protein